MKIFTRVIILVMLPGTFTFNSCKKNGNQRTDQNPPGTTVKQFIIKDLSWSYDSAAKKAFVNVVVPSNYSADSISRVYWFFIYFNKWNQVLKNGAETHHLYYTVVNSRLLLYYIFEINDPRTDVHYLINNLNKSYNTIKVEFI